MTWLAKTKKSQTIPNNPNSISEKNLLFAYSESKWRHVSGNKTKAKHRQNQIKKAIKSILAKIAFIFSLYGGVLFLAIKKSAKQLQRLIEKEKPLADNCSSI